MMIKAAIFDSSDNPVKLLQSSPRQLDANTPAQGYWREIPDNVEFLQDVPNPNLLPVYPDRLVVLLDLSQDYFDDEVLADVNNKVTFTAPAGLQITTVDMVTHTESGGSITVTFPAEGEQYVKIQETGKSFYSKVLDVVFFDAYQEKLKDMIDAQRDIRLVGPLTYNSITLDGDLTAQKNIAEAATFGAFQVLKGNTGLSMNWITAVNTIVSLSAADLEAFSAVIATRRETEYMASRAAKNAIGAATTKTAADAAYNAYLSP